MDTFYIETAFEYAGGIVEVNLGTERAQVYWSPRGDRKNNLELEDASGEIELPDTRGLTGAARRAVEERFAREYGITQLGLYLADSI